MKEIYAESVIEKVAGLMLNERADEDVIKNGDGGNINYGFFDYIASILIDPSYREEENSTKDTSSEYSSYDSDNDDSKTLSEQESDNSDENLYKPRKDFHFPVLDQLDLLLKETKTNYDLFLESVNIVRDYIPPEVWAKSQAEFVSPESNMYHYLQEMHMKIKSDEEMLSYIHFRAAARAYDACQVTNKAQNLNIMHKIFENNLQSIKDSLNNS